MKILIVDDELPIRRWIDMAIKAMSDKPWEVVGAAANGREALALAGETDPDVILTDIKMPFMDGLELLKAVKEQRPSTVVIILTCYNEFSYAKEAISHKAYDYILKTEMTSRTLKELLLKAEDEVRRAAARDTRTLNLRQEQFLNKLVREREEIYCWERLGEEFERYKIGLKEEAMFAAAVPAERFTEGMSALTSASFGDKADHVSYYSHQKDLIVVMANIVCIPSLLCQKNAIHEFAGVLQRASGSPVGVSGLYYSYRKVPDMIRESIDALNQRFYGGGTVFYRTGGVFFGQAQARLDECRDRICSFINAKQWEPSLELLQKMFGYLEKQRVYEVERVKRYLLSLMVCYFLKTHVDQSGLFSEAIDELSGRTGQAQSLAELKAFVFKTVENYLLQERAKCPRFSQHVQRAIGYLEKHYGGACSISETAEYVGLNADYLCRIFKSETGVTFSQYLTNVRLNESVYLLQNTDYKVYEIADMVGYSNLGYYSRIFKKKFSVTPFEFRNQQEEQDERGIDLGGGSHGNRGGGSVAETGKSGYGLD